jgi:hypothetical protein
MANSSESRRGMGGVFCPFRSLKSNPHQRGTYAIQSPKCQGSRPLLPPHPSPVLRAKVTTECAVIPVPPPALDHFFLRATTSTVTELAGSDFGLNTCGPASYARAKNMAFATLPTNLPFSRTSSSTRIQQVLTLDHQSGRPGRPSLLRVHASHMLQANVKNSTGGASPHRPAEQAVLCDLTLHALALFF